MNTPQRPASVKGMAKAGAVRLLTSFAFMAAAEWQKLIAEIRDAFIKEADRCHDDRR